MRIEPHPPPAVPQQSNDNRLHTGAARESSGNRRAVAIVWALPDEHHRPPTAVRPRPVTPQRRDPAQYDLTMHINRIA